MANCCQSGAFNGRNQVVNSLFSCTDLAGCSIDALMDIPTPSDGFLSYSAGTYSWVPATSDTTLTSATYNDATGLLTLIDSSAVTPNVTTSILYTQPATGPLGGGGTLAISAALDLANTCLFELKTLTGQVAGTTNFGVLPGDDLSDNATLPTLLSETATCLDSLKTLVGVTPNSTDFGVLPGAVLTDNATLAVLISEIATCLEDLKVNPATTTTVSTPDANGVVTVDDGTNTVDICTDPEHRVRLAAGQSCVYEVIEGCGAAATVVQTIDARKHQTFELGQASDHFVDTAITNQHCFIAPPAGVGTNIEILGGTYCVGGDVDLDLDIAGTVSSITGLSGTGDLSAATGAPTFPITLANLAVVREAVTAVNTAGEGVTLNFFYRYCAA